MNTSTANIVNYLELYRAWCYKYGTGWFTYEQFFKYILKI